jgi:hypothetical protein
MPCRGIKVARKELQSVLCSVPLWKKLWQKKDPVFRNRLHERPVVLSWSLCNPLVLR